MPLSEMAGGIAVLVEQFSNGWATIKTIVADSAFKAAWMSAGHKPNPTWLTGHSGCIEPGKLCSVFGETVDIGRLRVGVAVTSEVTITEIIGKDENDIRFFLGLSARCRQHEC